MIVLGRNYASALTLMRPKVYPLIKFHQVPELFHNIALREP